MTTSQKKAVGWVNHIQDIMRVEYSYSNVFGKYDFRHPDYMYIHQIEDSFVCVVRRGHDWYGGYCVYCGLIQKASPRWKNKPFHWTHRKPK